MKINGIALEKVQNLANNTIEENIDPSELARINEIDGSPKYELYRVAHTGISKTNFIGFGTRILKWFSDAIKTIHQNIKIGTKVFFGHVQNTNSTAGRDVLGRIVGKVLEVIGETVNSYGIVYRYPKFRDVETDIASYEGDHRLPLFSPTGAITVAPEDIGEITGLILAQSKKNSPAFSGATLQYAVQNLVEKENILDKEELKKLIKEGNFGIEDFFTNEQIIATKAVTEIKEASQNAYNQSKRLDKELKEAKGDLNLAQEDLAKAQGELTKSNSQILKLESEELTKELISERDLSPNRKRWVDKAMKSFVPTGEKRNIGKEINKTIDAAISDYNEGVKDGLFVDDTKTEKKADKTTEIIKEKVETNAPAKGTIGNPFNSKDGFSGLLGGLPDMPKSAQEGANIIFGKENNPEN